MKRVILASLVGSLVWLAGGAPAAWAQMTYPFRPPAYGPGYQTQLSPYLNMLRGGDPAANYYIGVVPEVQRRQDRNTIYGSLQTLGQLPPPPGVTDRPPDMPLASAGHPTYFGYTGTYFGGINNPGGGRPASNSFPSRRTQAPGQGPGGRGGSYPYFNTPQVPGMSGGMPGGMPGPNVPRR